MIVHKPFADAHTADAARFLAARHAADRQLHPLLPARFEDSSVARRSLEALRERRSGGVAALDGDTLCGYLIGTARESALLGRTVWFTPESYALAAGAPPDLLRELYAAQAEQWIDQGYFDHYAMAPADSPLLAAWLGLGFAYQQAYALLPLNEIEAALPTPGVEIRRAEPKDASALAAISPLTAGHQTRSPVFAPAPPDYFGELRTGYAELATDESAATAWLALRDGELIAVQAYYAVSTADENVLSDEGWIELAAAATHPDARGQGIGRALTAHGLQWARTAGYAVCLTDWRVANLLASRFWPRRGFTPVYYRLERRVDPRIAWARLR